MNDASPRIALVLKSAPHPNAKQPCCKLWLDFGPDIGILPCAPAMAPESGNGLEGQLVIASLLVEPINIKGFMVQAALFIALDHAGHSMALTPERDGLLGQKINHSPR